jgi:tight adherence protein B
MTGGMRAIAVAATLMLTVASPVMAAETSILEVVKVDGRTVHLLLKFAPNQEITGETPVSATLEFDGRGVGADANVVIDDKRPTLAVLALDASGSMKGERMTAAREAAIEFLEALPPKVQTGLVAFSDKIVVLAEPTTDRAALEERVSAVKPAGDTSLYDAVLASIDLVPAGARARLLVLSDGKDTTSRSSLKEVITAVSDGGIAVDVVALNPTAKELEALRTVSTPNDGNLRTATSSADLLAAFTAASQEYGASAFLTGTIPDAVDARAKPLSVQLRVGDQTIDASTTLPDVPSLSPASSSTGTGTMVLPAAATDAQNNGRLAIWPYIVAALAAGCVLLVALSIRWVKDERRSRDRLNHVLNYRVTVGPQAQVVRAPGLWGSFVGSLDRFLERRGSYRTTVTKLAGADLQYTPATWLLTRLAVIGIFVLLLALLLKSVPLALVMGALGGWLLSSWWLRSRAARRRKLFADELPTFLLLIASGLRAGLSFTSALDSSAAEGKGEVSRQMRRALGEVQLGAQLDDALMSCAERMDSDDLRWTVTALSIQREVGGNLSSILEAAADAIKQRYALRREVSTLSAEGRLSAYILVALPLGILGFLTLFRGEYVKVLWTTPVGMAMLGAFCVLILVGWIWMRSIVRIKV